MAAAFQLDELHRERVFSAGIFGLLPIALLDCYSARWASWVMLALQFGAAIGTLLLS
ncbi:hypothetical protein D3C81_2211300 [compost metagenome]|jgi:hypothetical protein